MTMRRFIRKIIPARVRQFLRDIAGITDLQARIGVLEEIVYESCASLEEKSRKRWRESDPNVRLTWGIDLDGDAFIAKATSYNAFESGRAILEIGPGYGRLLKSIIGQKVPFKNYLGVDISEKQVKYLAENFQDARLRFEHGNIENVLLNGSFDVALSSLTFKHLFPTFEKALSNIARHMNPAGLIFFDLIKGGQKHFELDNGEFTSLREYEKPEIEEILGRCSLELVAYDTIQHAPGYSRLLVVARKPI